jgi:5-methylcytosine-specific restriction endonuclease McrA
MRYVYFDPAALIGEQRLWFDNWMRRAARATRRACKLAEEGERIRLTEGVWSDLKAWLLDNVFAGKCAYCESKMLANSYGAADHYRPKGRVTERTSAGRLLPCERGGARHPGYYWLAYHWQNLVPICERCNSGSGKQDQFPVAGHRVFSHAELTNPSDVAELDSHEMPLLLHPYADDPAAHIHFGVQGVVAPLNGSVRGRATITICELDREPLNEERRRTQEEVRHAVADAYYQAGHGLATLEEALDAVRDRFTSAGSRYSAAADHEFTERLLEHVRVLQRLVG